MEFLLYFFAANTDFFRSFFVYFFVFGFRLLARMIDDYTLLFGYCCCRFFATFSLVVDYSCCYISLLLLFCNIFKCLVADGFDADYICKRGM